VRLEELRWTDLHDRAASSLLVVPVGSTEQHGPHLPLATDTRIAEALCHRLSLARADVLVAPALPYGAAGEHSAFAGTLSIGTAATELVLIELGRSADVFGGVLFVSSHGGNSAAVRSAVSLLQGESRPVRAWAPKPLPDVDGDWHAGFVETSVLLALAPDLVRPGSAETGPVAPLASILPEMQTHGVRAVSPNGVLGDPTGASAEAGASILDTWTDDLTSAVAGWP
jgi:mycofactocin precursor peptide peptidase